MKLKKKRFHEHSSGISLILAMDPGYFPSKKPHPQNSGMTQAGEFPYTPNMNSKILLVGSLAFDVIFSVPEDFRKSFPTENGEIRSINAVFMANKKTEYPGGTAGNICFWLGEEGVKSTVFSAFGKDFAEKKYKEKLKKTGGEVRGREGEFTAHAYMISDPVHQQVIIWQPNAYEENEKQSLLEYFSKEEIEQFEYALFSAGTPHSIHKHMKEFRAKNAEATIVFDPGQVSSFFDERTFKECCKMADILVGNDVEFQQFQSLGIPENIQTIETLGAEGVRIGEEKFPAHKVECVVETTGAGDAFRAGVLSALSQGKSLEEGIENGMKLGAECVQLPSGQR